MPSDRARPNGGLAVDDAEVHGLGVAALLGRDHQRRDAEDFGGGAGVDVFAVAEGFDQHRVARHVRQQAQLDLRIVGDDQFPAWAGHEGGADFAA